MKILTCAQLGGPCNFKMTAATENEMKAMAWKHVMEAHPEKMEDVNKMKDAGKEAAEMAAANFHMNWEAAPEDP